jgi:hypothetical protein
MIKLHFLIALFTLLYFKLIETKEYHDKIIGIYEYNGIGNNKYKLDYYYYIQDIQNNPFNFIVNIQSQCLSNKIFYNNWNNSSPCYIELSVLILSNILIKYKEYNLEYDYLLNIVDILNEISESSIITEDYLYRKTILLREDLNSTHYNNRKFHFKFHSADFYSSEKLLDTAINYCNSDARYILFYKTFHMPCHYDIIFVAIDDITTNPDYSNKIYLKGILNTKEVILSKFKLLEKHYSASADNNVIELQDTMQNIEQNVIDNLLIELNNLYLLKENEVEITKENNNDIDNNNNNNINNDVIDNNNNDNNNNKISFLFIVNRDLTKENIWKNWLNLLNIDYNIYVHCSTPSNINSLWFKNFLIPNEYIKPTKWGILADAITSLIEYALIHNNKWYILLSESHVPFVNPFKFINYYNINKNKSIISFKKHDNIVEDRCNMKLLPKQYWIENEMWLILSKNDVNNIITFKNNNPNIYQVLISGAIADECYLSIILTMCNNLTNVINNATTLVDWNRGIYLSIYLIIYLSKSLYL